MKKPICVYKTSDGKIFETYDEAAEWENVYSKIGEMQEYFNTLFHMYYEEDDYGAPVIYNLDAIAKHIATNFEEIKSIMDKE